MRVGTAGLRAHLSAVALFSAVPQLIEPAPSSD